MRKLIITIGLLLISGCFDMTFLFGDKRKLKVKPKIDPNSPEFRKSVSLILKQRHNPEFLKRMAFEKELKKYKEGKQ